MPPEADPPALPGTATGPVAGELWERNAPIVDPDDQVALASARVLVAGCGSVGGAAVEPLVRLGLGALVLADPDVYEVHNLNRQTCDLADVGRPKAEVLARRAGAINPGVDVVTLTAGLTPENIDAAVAGVTLVVDGVDSTGPALPVKLRLHELAGERRLPTIAAADLAGQATLYVFDYRRDPRPLRGRAPLRAFREGRELEASGMTGPRPIPTDFFPLVRHRLDSQAPWPQLAYTAAATGALTAAVALELLRGRRVPSLVRVDLHRAARSRGARLAVAAQRPAELVRTALAVARHGKEAAPPRVEIPGWARPALEALQAAPSPHNEQPWAMAVAGPRTLRLQPRPTAYRPGGRDDDAAAVSLGCALAAVEGTVAATAGLDGLAAEIAVEGEPDRGALDLQRARQTSRAPYSAAAIPAGRLAGLAATAERHGAIAAVVEGAKLGRCAAAVAVARSDELQDAAAMSELLAWYRSSPRDRRYDGDGLLPGPLGLGRRGRLGLAIARGGRLPATGRLLRLALARRLEALVRHSAALLVLAPGGEGLGERVALGRALMSVWLEATASGLAVHPIGLPDGRGGGPLGDLLGAPLGAAPLVVRLGNGVPARPRSPRLPLERLLLAEAPL